MFRRQERVHSVVLPGETPVHARTQSEPMPNTFGSNKPTRHDCKLGENLIFVNITLKGRAHDFITDHKNF